MKLYLLPVKYHFARIQRLQITDHLIGCHDNALQYCTNRKGEPLTFRILCFTVVGSRKMLRFSFYFAVDYEYLGFFSFFSYMFIGRTNYLCIIIFIIISSSSNSNNKTIIIENLEIL